MPRRAQPHAPLAAAPLLLALLAPLAPLAACGPTGATRSAYEPCDPGRDACRTGACVAAHAVSAAPGRSATLCTASCRTSTDCPAADGAPGVCVIAASGSQCYRGCAAAGAACPAGFACARAGTSAAYCVPVVRPGLCGAADEPCCPPAGDAGASCEPGAACVDGRCARQPYTACAGADGGRCLAGRASSGETIATACQRPMLLNAGADGFCTASCAFGSDAGVCPRPALAGATAACVWLLGTPGPQCFVACGDAGPCPGGTICARVQTNTGPQAQVCIPPTT